MTTKRILDIAVSLPLLVLLSPVFGLVALAILVDLGRPVFFRQQRPGHRGRLFELVKFRTMRHPDLSHGPVRPDHSRITWLGGFLRRSSLDELPELWNVVRGEMSLVGPRPLLPQYLPRYTPEQMRRHEVPPGMTGWAQINGRNALSWDEKFALDLWYIDNRSLALDITILLRTAGAALRGHGVSHSETQTMPPFLGTEARDRK